MSASSTIRTCEKQGPLGKGDCAEDLEKRATLSLLLVWDEGGEEVGKRHGGQGGGGWRSRGESRHTRKEAGGGGEAGIYSVCAFIISCS